MNASRYYATVPSPLGELVLTSDGAGLTGLYTPSHRRHAEMRQSMRSSTTPFAQAIRQLTEYFAGMRTEFDLPLAPMGTAFQQRVWQALCAIPFGETRSYGTLARGLGAPAASRAVGAANARNPISIVVPCHRVIGADGTPTGYAGGIAAKEWLLRHEGGR